MMISKDEFRNPNDERNPRVEIRKARLMVRRMAALGRPAVQMVVVHKSGRPRVALRRVIVPQATRLVIPPVTNDFIALFKDTAVCSVITVVELSKQYYIHARDTGAIVELGIVTCALYLALSYPLSLVAGALERRLAPDRAR